MGETARKPSTTKLEIEELLLKLEALPTLPSIMYELNRIINNPASSAGDITKIMEKDQSLTLKVLKLINSAYYAIPGGVTSLQRAIAYLGYDTINQLVMAASVFKVMNKENASSFSLSGFWKHSVGVAMTAETLAKWCKHKAPGDCFTAGLLHDLGKIALYQVAPDYLEMIVNVAQEDKISMIASEQQLQAISHTTVGSMMAKLWKLPPVIEGPILYHHESDPLKRGMLKPEHLMTVDIIFFANGIVHELGFGNSGHDQKIPMAGPLLKRLNLTAVQLPLILKDIVKNLASADDFIKIITV